MRWLLCLLCAWLGFGASVMASSAAHATASHEPGELVFFNRTVFVFRDSFTGIAPADRAKRAQSRIRYQLERSATQALVSVKPDSTGMMVQIGEATSFIITPADLDSTREQTLQQAADEAADALRLSVTEYYQARSWNYWLQALGYALGATLVAGLGVMVARKGRRALARRLIVSSTDHVSRLALAGVPLIRRERAVWAIRALMQLVYRLVVLVLLVEWAGFVLLQFPFTRSWGESLNQWIWELMRQGLAFVATVVPELCIAVVILYCTHALARALGRFLALVQEGSVKLAWLDADMVAPTQRIVTVVVWVFGLAMAYPYLPGSQTEAFKGLSVLVGVMVSLGASGMVGQAVSGMILTYGRIYRVGEYVRLGEHEGTVTDVGAFTTRLRTGLGEEVTISNASILAGTTKNYSRAVQGAGYVLDTTVTIGYDTPWRQVHAMLIEAASMTEGVLHEPAPQVFQTALSDWYPEYRLVCQAIPAQPRPRALLLSALHANIQDVFNRYGVQIMSPQYFEDPAEPKLVPPEKWYTAPAKAPPK